MYILIIMWVYGASGAVSTAEFNGVENCQNAAAQVMKAEPRYKAICVYRGR